MKKTSKKIRDESRDLFLERFGGEPPLKLLYFHTFLCPVTDAEAMVKEYIIEDYDALELLTLRLYAAGIKSEEAIAALSGMKPQMIKRALDNEKMVYFHIDEETGKLTDMGKETLLANENGKAESHVMYDTPRKLQIEAATGTVIPGYLEEKNLKQVKSILEDKADGIVPRESVIIDEILAGEINDRLNEYKHMDILNEGDTIKEIKSIHATQIFYRWAYLAKFEGMKYPMIVMLGKKSIDNVGRESVKENKYGMRVAVPLAISNSDDKYLRAHNIVFDDVIKRDDTYFEYLAEQTANFNFDLETDDVLTEEEIVFEDELTLEEDDSIE